MIDRDDVVNFLLGLAVVLTAIVSVPAILVTLWCVWLHNLSSWGGY